MMFIFVIMSLWLIAFTIISFAALLNYGNELINALKNREEAGGAVGWFVTSWVAVSVCIVAIVLFLSVFIHTCPNCQDTVFSVEGKPSYCSECGCSMKQETAEEQPLVCVKCNNTVNADDNFCCDCGAEIKVGVDEK